MIQNPSNSSEDFDVELRIEGENITPEAIQLSDLAYILDNFQRAVQACSEHANSFESIHISLTDVKPGSSRYPIAANPAARRYSEQIIVAIDSRDGSKIPLKARQYLENIHGRSKKRQWSLGLSAVSPRGELKTTKIPPHVKKLFDGNLVFGESSIVATVMKAGGDTGNRMAELRLLDGSKLTARVNSQQLTQQIGEMLYEQVELYGRAAWDAETWKLRTFKVTSLGDYRQKYSDPSSAVDQLKNLVGDNWQSPDADFSDEIEDEVDH